MESAAPNIEDKPKTTIRVSGSKRWVAAKTKRFLPIQDMRSVEAKRFKNLYVAITDDLGGEDILSEGQRQLARRAAMLSASAEMMEGAWAEGSSEFDIGLYTIIANSLKRVLDAIGLERIAKPVNDEGAALSDHFSRRPARTIEGEAAE